jgi:hypothetical protein
MWLVGMSVQGWGVRDTMLTIDRTLFVPSYNSEVGFTPRLLRTDYYS